MCVGYMFHYKENGRFTTHISFTLTVQVLFNPADNTLVSAVGDCIFKLYRYTEGSLKQVAFQKAQPIPIRCHVWLTEDKLVIGTETGHVMIYHGGELRQDLELQLPVPASVM